MRYRQMNDSEYFSGEIDYHEQLLQQEQEDG